MDLDDIMARLVIGLLVGGLIVGCLWAIFGPPSPPPEHRDAADKTDSTVEVWHDDQRRVTCWILWPNNGLSCLPDRQFMEPR